MTGKLFPSGEQQQMLPVQPPASLSNIQPFDARVTLIDSANPFIFVDAAFISTQLQQAGSPDGQHALMESIRQQGAVAMGLAASTEIASKTRGTPKIALISAPLRRAGKPTSDIRIAAYSMGLPHPTLCSSSSDFLPRSLLHRLWIATFSTTQISSLLSSRRQQFHRPNGTSIRSFKQWDHG